MTASVFIRSQATDVEYAVVSVSSVTMNLPSAFEMVVAVPPQDVALFHGHLSDMSTTSGKIKVLPEKPLVKGCGHPMQETYTRSVADTYCQDDYVLQLQADAVLARKLYHKDLFLAGKPIVMTTNTKIFIGPRPFGRKEQWMRWVPARTPSSFMFKWRSMCFHERCTSACVPSSKVSMRCRLNRFEDSSRSRKVCDPQRRRLCAVGGRSNKSRFFHLCCIRRIPVDVHERRNFMDPA
jgi:hypothetical protein